MTATELTTNKLHLQVL